MKYLTYSFFHNNREHLSHHGKQFIRYATVGGLMLVISLVTVSGMMNFFGVHYLLACGVAFIFESIVAFFINKYWTFGSDVSFMKGYVRFVIIAFYSTVVILFITYGLTHYLALHYVWARTASTVIMGVCGYFMDMRLAFRV